MGMMAYITNAGLTALNALIAAQKAVVFSKAEVGRGVCTVESQCKARTSLVTKTGDALVSGVTLDGGMANVAVQYSNAGISTTQTVNEIGLYIRNVSNADVLFAYVTFGDGTTPDYIYPASAAQYIRVYNIMASVAGATSVSVIMSASAMQKSIGATGILKGNGNGDVVAAMAGVDYAAANHTHTSESIEGLQELLDGKADSLHNHGMSDVDGLDNALNGKSDTDHTHALNGNSVKGILPVSHGGTGAETVGSQLLNNLGIIYSESAPSTSSYMIWFKPV